MNDKMKSFVHLFLTHMGERNLAAITDLFAESVDWFIPGDETAAPWLGRRSSNAEVRKFYELLWQRTEPVSTRIEHIFTNAEHAVITGEFSTRMLASEKIVDSLFCIQLKVAADKIIRYRLIEDSYAVSQSLSR